MFSEANKIISGTYIKNSAGMYDSYYKGAMNAAYFLQLREISLHLCIVNLELY